MSSTTPVSPILPAIASEGDEVVEDAGRADDQDVEEVELPAVRIDDQAEAEGNVGQESAPRKALPSPYMPTISEIRLHKTTHLPYRSWCDECVEAFAREWPHLRHSGPSGRSIPVVHMDYACLTEKGLFKKNEMTEEELQHAVRVIVAYCSGTGSPFMHVVPSKATSTDRFAAERVVEDIVFLGHTRVILRSDNEPALLQLVSSALGIGRVRGVSTPRPTDSWSS